MNILKKTKSFLGLKELTFSPSDPLQKVIGGLGDKFFGLLDKTFSERRQNPDNSALTPEEIQATIKRYSTQNMAIAAAAAAVPGPLGILSSAGELVLITGNQLKMIYDIGCAYDRESFLNKDLLLDIPMQAMGISTDLSEIQDQLDSLQEPSIEILKEKSLHFAKAIAHKNVKKSLVKMIPIGGSLLMSVWTKKGTKKVAKIAENFMDGAKVLEGIPASRFQEEEPKELLVERIKIMATLMEQNGQIKDEELQFLVPIIQSAPIEENEKQQLLSEAKRLGSHFDIDFNALKQFPDVVDDLMSDLVVLAKRDGHVGANEMAYLKAVARELGEPEEEWMELLELEEGE